MRAAFVDRPRAVEGVPGFCGLEVFVDQKEPSAFLLLTRWFDEQAFRSWHASPDHRESHSLMPPGLKLDPKGTELIMASRIDGATTEADDGELVLDLLPSVARLIREGAAVYALEVDGEGKVLRVSGSFSAAIDGLKAGVPLAACVPSTTIEVLHAAAQGPSDQRVLAQFSGPGGSLFTLRCEVVELPGGGFAVVGEPPWDQHRALEEQLFAINGELSLLMRENARQARALEAAHRELRDTHWHLKKVSSVLPICMACQRVNTGEGEDSWEAVESYLKRSSSFLSHGYCARCARSFEDEEDDPEALR